MSQTQKVDLRNTFSVIGVTSLLQWNNLVMALGLIDSFGFPGKLLLSRVPLIYFTTAVLFNTATLGLDGSNPIRMLTIGNAMQIFAQVTCCIACLGLSGTKLGIFVFYISIVLFACGVSLLTGNAFGLASLTGRESTTYVAGGIGLSGLISFITFLIAVSVAPKSLVALLPGYGVGLLFNISSLYLLGNLRSVIERRVAQVEDGMDEESAVFPGDEPQSMSYIISKVYPSIVMLMIIYILTFSLFPGFLIHLSRQFSPVVQTVLMGVFLTGDIVGRYTPLSGFSMNATSGNIYSLCRWLYMPLFLFLDTTTRAIFHVVPVIGFIIFTLGFTHGWANSTAFEIPVGKFKEINNVVRSGILLGYMNIVAICLGTVLCALLTSIGLFPGF